MIKGLGIDLTEISRVGELASKHPQFLDRVLTTAEQKQYHGFTGQRALEYLPRPGEPGLAKRSAFRTLKSSTAGLVNRWSPGRPSLVESMPRSATRAA